ncbi:hypothetical protein B0H10DRAFT_416124 [Mycena sp. CBHHK59/15]|nr:hypothetical protein B0H10DRAFT_416124 [Mycena sp. CBHHK59/15]
MQSHEAQHYPSTAANQSGPSQTAAQQRETYPQQVFQPDGRKQTYSQQQRDLFMSGTISQPNFQPQSEHSQREIRLDPQQRESQSFGAQSHQRQPSASAVLTQSNYTPQAPSQYQGGTHSQSNSRPQTQSQQRETQPSAPMHSNLDSQAHQQIQVSAAPTQSNSRPQQLSQLTPHSSLPHAKLQQRDSQLSAPTHSNSRPQVQRTSQPSTSANANPQAQPPNQPNLQPQLPSQQNSASQPQSQQRPTQASAPPTHANSVPQGPTQTSQGNSRPQGQPQHREAQPPVTATQSNSRPLAQSQAAPTQPHNPSFPSATVPATAAPAPSRSYGPSPFAHVPAATAGQSHQQANSSAVPNPNTTSPTVPNGRSVQHAGSSRPAPAQGSSTDSRAPGPSELPSLSNAHYVLFLAVIVSWQLSCPPVSFMEIPPARIKVIKAPDGLHYMQAHAQTGEMMEITAPSAFVIAQHFLAGKRASLYSNAKGIVQLVAEPLTAAQKMTHKFYVTKVAATALLEDKTGHGAAALAAAAAPAPSLALAGTTKRPPPDDSATRQRGPQDADRRFVARDLLWQLTPLPRYAPDEDVLRYAKRRAIEAPEPVSRTWTAAAVAAAARRVEVGSSESSAKTTPEPPTRTPSVAPSPPPPPPPQEQEQKKQRVPLFLPDGSPPPMTFGKAERLMAPVEGRGSSRRQASGSRASSPTCYVLVPEAPEYVRRHQARVRKQKQTRLEAIQAAAAEEAAELEVDERELMRRRALGMPSLNVCRAWG